MRKSMGLCSALLLGLASAATAQVVPQAPVLEQTSTLVATSVRAEQMPVPGATASAPKAASVHGLKRWIDLQTATLSTRYRVLQRLTDGPVTGELQHQQLFKLRLNADPSGRFGVGASVQAGASSTSGWDDAGLGANAPTSKLTVRQLFATARPAKWLELQYGGLGVVRGESTEITTYDNDLPIVGARASARGPKVLFNELSVTQGYFGDHMLPSFFDRAERLDQVNYRQVFVARDISKRVKASLDVTTVDGTRTFHQGVKVRLAGSHVLDSARLETYQRRADDATGYAVSLERALGPVLFGGGWTDIDKGFSAYGGDRYGRGTRIVSTLATPLANGFTLNLFYAHAVERDMKQPNRAEVIVTYDVLKTLRARKVL